MIHDRGKLKPVLVAARRAGLTLKQAAARAGVHVATVCRWQAADPDFLRGMRDAEREYRVELLATRPSHRPAVRWRNECPVCRARLVVRTANRRVAFWRCGRWPRCPWASWRPRHPRDCPTCQGPRFWSHSRKSVVCDHCRVRNTAPEQHAPQAHKSRTPGGETAPPRCEIEPFSAAEEVFSGTVGRAVSGT